MKQIKNVIINSIKFIIISFIILFILYINVIADVFSKITIQNCIYILISSIAIIYSIIFIIKSSVKNLLILISLLLIWFLCTKYLPDVSKSIDRDICTDTGKCID